MSGRSLARLGDRSKQLCRPCTLTRSSVFTDVSEKKIKCSCLLPQPRYALADAF